MTEFASCPIGATSTSLRLVLGGEGDDDAVVADLERRPSGRVVGVADLERLAHAARELDALAIDRARRSRSDRAGSGPTTGRRGRSARDRGGRAAARPRAPAALAALARSPRSSVGLDPEAEVPGALRRRAAGRAPRCPHRRRRRGRARDTARPRRRRRGCASGPRRASAASPPTRTGRRVARDRRVPRGGRCRRPRAATPRPPCRRTC